MITRSKSVFLIGTAYSGSSVLGMALHNNRSSVAYVGELSRIPAFLEKYSLDLHVGECSACQITNQTCPVFTDSVLAKLGDKSPAEAHAYLAKYLRVKTVVDGSKHPAWLRQFSTELPNEKIRVILTVRNPKNYVQSCLDRQIGTAWQAANAWRDTYFDALRTLARANIAYYIVRNEDFVRNPVITLTHVQSFLGLPARKASPHKVIHAIGGNPAAHAMEFSPKRIKATAERLGSAVFDLNPVRKTPISPQKITFDTQVLFDTPGLSDVANILGYQVNNLV